MFAINGAKVDTHVYSYFTILGKTLSVLITANA